MASTTSGHAVRGENDRIAIYAITIQATESRSRASMENEDDCQSGLMLSLNDWRSSDGTNGASSAMSQQPRNRTAISCDWPTDRCRTASRTRRGRAIAIPVAIPAIFQKTSPIAASREGSISWRTCSQAARIKPKMISAIIAGVRFRRLPRERIPRNPYGLKSAILPNSSPRLENRDHCIEKPFNACIGQRVERKIEWVKRPVQDQEYGTIK